jgi:outer membrane protein TolC
MITLSRFRPKTLKLKNMKQVLFVALLFTCSFIYAQVNPTQPARTSTYHLNADSAKIVDIRERLVQLALQDPLYEIADHNVTIAEYEIRLAKNSWLAEIFIAGNLNEFSIDPKAAGTNYSGYYPRYNFGVQIPLDIFSKTSNNVKISHEKYMIAEAERNDRFRLIKADILTRYEDYLLTKQKLEIQYQITQDAYTAYTKAEKDFNDNVIKIEDLNSANSRYIDEQVKKLQLQRDLNVSKIDIERHIGIKLDEVIQQMGGR